jgi:UDP-N-acetylmuramoylalanine--D-glutamate ligase
MIAVSQYRGKKVGVFGLGKAGEAAISSLRAGGAVVYAADDNEKSACSGLSNGRGMSWRRWC